MVNAICKEAALRQHYINESIATIYFGGGTPSLIEVDDLQKLIEKLHALFIVEKDAEITIETNPDDITQEKLIAWKGIGINRLSIGVQSFFEEDLQWMNRAHHANHALACLQLARQHFDNITIDLIYGTPTLSDEQWKQNIETALSLGINHISCYALTVEPKTALEKLIEKKQLADVDADKQARHFDILVERLQQAGFEHYETSNFARPSFRSRHNSSYWQGKHYLGLGPSAHSFNGGTRQWNIANNPVYMKHVLKSLSFFEREELSANDRFNEYMLTGLRTMWGVSANYITSHFEQEFYFHFLNAVKPYLERGLVLELNGTYTLSRDGKLLADRIASELFI